MQTIAITIAQAAIAGSIGFAASWYVSDDTVYVVRTDPSTGVQFVSNSSLECVDTRSCGA